jgi:ABC-type nitrate/sulfonate/bicarbonate transport system permease component
MTRRALNWFPAVAVLVLGLVLWQESIALLHIKRFLAPQPTTIAVAMWDGRHELLRAIHVCFEARPFFGSNKGGVGKAGR